MMRSPSFIELLAPDQLRHLHRRIASWRRQATWLADMQRAMPLAMQDRGVEMRRNFIVGVRLLSAERLEELLACGDVGLRDAVIAARSEDAPRTIIDGSLPLELVAAEQFRWLLELAASQEDAAAWHEEVAATSALQAAVMRECAAHARARFIAGVRVLPEECLHRLLVTTDDSLREAAIAALGEVASNSSTSGEPNAGDVA